MHIIGLGGRSVEGRRRDEGDREGNDLTHHKQCCERVEIEMAARHFATKDVSVVYYEKESEE